MVIFLEQDGGLPGGRPAQEMFICEIVDEFLPNMIKFARNVAQ
jgi:hypothetical protein